MTDGAKYNNSALLCLRVIAQEEGVTSFWAGNGVNMVRIIPSNALMFFAKPFIQTNLKAIIPDPTLAGIASGMAAGCVSNTAIYPLDLVRLRMTTTPGLYPNFLSGLATIAKVEGVGGLFKGVQYANAWAIPYAAALFGTNDQLKSLAKTYGIKVNGLTGAAFGAVSGMVSTFVAFPIESMRRKLQAQGTGGRPVIYSGLIDTFRQVLAANGVRGLYVGCAANIVKMAPAQAITFGCMDALKPVVTKWATSK